MGVSTNGILFYGICVDPEDVEIPWHEGDMDIEEYYAKQMGLDAPDEEYSDEVIIQDKYHKFWKERNKIHAASKCEVVYHCSYDYPMYGMAISDSVITARRGYPEEIKNINKDAQWEALLKNYCEKMGVKFEQPRWWLVSLWG